MWEFGQSKIELTDVVRGTQSFVFSNVFSDDANNAAVYKTIASGIVASALAGYNGTVFAYGQTGSGKTHSVQGSSATGGGGKGQADEDPGIIARAVADVFAASAKDPSRLWTLSVSYVEIYNEGTMLPLSSFSLFALN